MKLANTIRLGVRQVRLNAEKTFDKKREEVQQQMLSYKTEDQLWLKAKQTMQILTREIEEQARWKEETKQRYEAEQRELKVQQRIVSVSKFAPEMPSSEFEHMSDEGFSLFLSGIEKQYLDRVEYERKLEEDRIAKEKEESEERERIKAENERLKKETEEKEAKRKAEIEAQEKKAKEEARLRAIEEAKKQAELDKIKAELEDERKRKEEAEKEEQYRIESELKKGDSDKVKDLINDLTLLKSKYQFKSQKNVKMYSDVYKLLDKVVAYIQQA
jgi:hypothetical protein